VVTAFRRCYGDIAWAKIQAEQYWHDSGFPENERPDFFDAILSARSHTTFLGGEWSKIFIAAQDEVRAMKSFPHWWDEELDEEASKCRSFADAKAAKLEADKAKLEKVD
jgi:hypothetical protein